MKLLAGSLNVEVDAFLHAGYLSSGGRSFNQISDRALAEHNTKLIDVKRSLDLKDTGSPSDPPAQLTTAETPTPAPVGASLASEGFLVGIVLLFFGCLTIHYGRRLRAGSWSRWRTQLLTAAPLLLISVVSIGVFSVIPLYDAYQLNYRPPPWAGVPLQEYNDPEAATEAILHGLVANALPGCPILVQKLGAIRHEVTFPLPAEQWTPGMAYAARTYGIDGWGREFTFQPLTEGRYRIASAGPDGVHGTRDDIVLSTSRKKKYDWEQLVNGVYVRRVGERYTYFVHRVAHVNYRSPFLAAARELTDTNVFDMVWPYDLDMRSEQGVAWQNHVVAQLRIHRAAQDGEGDANPLFFVQISRADDG